MFICAKDIVNIILLKMLYKVGLIHMDIGKIYYQKLLIVLLLLIKIIGNPPMKIASVNSFILFALWIPLPFISDILSIGGKSLLEYTYLFLVGYYIFSNDATLDLLENKRKLTLMIGLISSGTNIYLFCGLIIHIIYLMLQQIT